MEDHSTIVAREDAGAMPFASNGVGAKSERRNHADPEIDRLAELPKYDWVASLDEGIVAIPASIRNFVCVLLRAVRIHGETTVEDIDLHTLPKMVSNRAIELEAWVVVTGRVRDLSRVRITAIILDIERLLPGVLVHRRPVVASAAIIDALYQKAYADLSASKEEDVSLEQDEFDRIGRYALLNEVSDIHIESNKSAACILLRRHGRLQHHKDLSPAKARAICAAAYNTLTESGSIRDAFNERHFQNAVIERAYEEGRVRFRYASMPVAPDGFNVVLRLLPLGLETKRKSYEELGYAPSQIKTIRRGLGRASGMFIIAGTTGSGKSTTLQSAIEAIAAERPYQKIRTIEEPVEYRIKGASQTPVVRNESDGDGAASDKPFIDAIKACMRADPDFLMIGEVRDIVTARLAIQAAQTGHQVATTVHADSWSGIIDRLHVIGVDTGLLSQPGLLSGLCYQKLLPVLCPACRVPASRWQKTAAGQRPEHQEVIERLKRVVSEADLDQVFFSHEDGCQKCQGSGIVGQSVTAEVALPNNAMLNAIREGNIVELRRIWRTTATNDPADMTGRTAFEHALWKMRAGTADPRDVEHRFRMLDEVLESDF